MVGFTIYPSKDKNVKESDRLPGVDEFVGEGLGMASDNGKELIFQRNSKGVLKIYAAQLLPEGATFSSDVKEVKEKILEEFKEFDERLLNFIKESDDEISVVWRRYTGDPEYRRELRLGAELVGDANMALTGEVSQENVARSRSKLVSHHVFLSPPLALPVSISHSHFFFSNPRVPTSRWKTQQIWLPVWPKPIQLCLLLRLDLKSPKLY